MTEISIESFGGTEVGDFDLLLAPDTAEEIAEYRADLLDLEQAELDAAAERPYFI